MKLREQCGQPQSYGALRLVGQGERGAGSRSNGVLGMNCSYLHPWKFHVPSAILTQSMSARRLCCGKERRG